MNLIFSYMSNLKFKKLQAIRESLLKMESNKYVQNYLGLLKQLEECEREVKEYAKTTGNEYKSDTMKVQVIQVYKKEYDYSILRKIAEPNQMAKIDSITTKTVDRKKLEEMVENGVIPAKLAQKSFREEQNTPRVFIKYLI